MQRIFNCHKMHVISITSYEVLNSLVRYMDHLSASSYTRVTNCQKWSDFAWFKLIGILAQYGFYKHMPRIFKYGDIPNINFTPDKVLNILIYRLPTYLIIYRSHTLLKMVRFYFGPPCICIQSTSINNAVLKGTKYSSLYATLC